MQEMKGGTRTDADVWWFTADADEAEHVWVVERLDEVHLLGIVRLCVKFAAVPGGV